MCLTRVDERYEPPLPTVRAWKVFWLDEERLMPEFGWPVKRFFDGPVYYEEDQWYEAISEPVYFWSFQSSYSYPAGFHGFSKREEALAWGERNQVLREVELREVHTRGSQTPGDDKTVYVARLMRIIPPGEVPK